MKHHLFIALIPLLIPGTVFCQSTTGKKHTTASENYSQVLSSPTVIKWTKQLPKTVKTSFFKTRFAEWYIEKMIRYNSNGTTAYRFFINNGNLLDGDHLDSFIKRDSIDITDKGAILNDYSMVAETFL